MSKFKDRYVLAEGYPQLFFDMAIAIHHTNLGKENEPPEKKLKWPKLKWPKALNDVNLPRYRLVLERIDDGAG